METTSRKVKFFEATYRPLAQALYDRLSVPQRENIRSIVNDEEVVNFKRMLQEYHVTMIENEYENTYCICGCKIQHTYKIVNLKTGSEYSIGSECIKQFPSSQITKIDHQCKYCNRTKKTDCKDCIGKQALRDIFKAWKKQTMALDIMQFGKHIGKTYGWIIKNDPRYITYCIDNDIGSKGFKQSVEQIQYIMERKRLKN